MSFTLPRTKALHEAILGDRRGVPVHRVAGQLGSGARHLPPGHHAGAVREYFPVRDAALIAHATQIDP